MKDSNFDELLYYGVELITGQVLRDVVENFLDTNKAPDYV